MMDNFRIETPLGVIIVTPTDDPDHPGIWVDLRRTDVDQDATLALIEFCNDDVDMVESNIVTRVWEDVCGSDYSTRVVHKGIEKFFEVS